MLRWGRGRGGVEGGWMREVRGGGCEVSFIELGHGGSWENKGEGGVYNTESSADSTRWVSRHWRGVLIYYRLNDKQF